MILFTGGSGLLGGSFKELFPNALFPSHQSFTVEDYGQINTWVNNFNDLNLYKGDSERIDTIVHCAAMKNQQIINRAPMAAILANIHGTCNIVRVCSHLKIRLIYISTDYIFSGKNGLYDERSPLNPLNKYGLSKLGGECAVRMYDNSLVIRTSFSSRKFPHKKATIDQWTSREPVDVIAKKIKPLIESEVTGIMHVGGKRISVYEYAQSLDAKVEKASIKDFAIRLPVDTSLDTSKYEKLMGRTDESTDNGVGGLHRKQSSEDAS